MKGLSAPELDWDHLRVFAVVARTLNLAAAAHDLKTSQSTVHRRLQALETSLGTRLFLRRTTGHSLTGAGERLLTYAEQFDKTVQALRRDVGDQNVQVTGQVRISTTHVGGDYILLPALPAFYARYPDITLEIEALPQAVDLLRAEANLALRFARPQSGDLVIRKLALMPCSLFASNLVIERYDLIETVENYKKSPYIGWAAGFTEIFLSVWLLKAYPHRRPAAALSSLQAHIEAAHQHLGVVNLPCFIGAQSGLQRVLPAGSTGTLEVWLVIPRQIRHTRKIELVAEFIEQATLAQLGGHA